MKTDIQKYPEFYKAIKTESLVYLFGTGISSAFTGCKYSWWKWLYDGISRMKDTGLAAACEKSLKADSSSGNMIALAGEILTATKADGTYHSWMKESFETNPVTNEALSQTLRKLLLSQDVFATTNYDLLLEQATGLGTLSYENPDQAFSMLDRHVSTHVLHIHGVYDSISGLDNIIADDDQYKAIMGNEGAQFIQNILGTRTLVFVGCGKTTEDGNISRFIQFAKDHLKMDREYYFLYRATESITGMPGNVRLIPYGDQYEDLPLFLEDMAQVRLRSFIEKNPLIGRTAYENTAAAADPLQRYHYSQQTIPFSGRTDELKGLHDFVRSSGDFCWWSVTGQGGSGKSRLALELLGQLPPAWFGFFINDRVSVKDADSFTPFANTLIVVDYVSGRENTVAEIMRRLRRQFETTPYQLRILLLERENSRKAGSWYAKLLHSFGRYDAREFADMEYGSGAFLKLGDLEKAAVEQFIGSVCARYGLKADSDRDRQLCEIYGQKFEKLRFRPLFVQIFVEAWIENGFALPRYDSFEDLLKYILEREQERWLDTLDGDQQCCNAFIHLLLRANITGQLDIAKMPAYYREDWDKVNRFIAEHSFPGRQREEQKMSVIHSICQDIEEHASIIAPLFPDIIKEYMFCFYMEEERLSETMNELWQNAAKAFSIFITRCLTDFPDNAFYQQALQAYDGNTTDSEVLLGRLSLLQKNVIEDDDDPEVLIGIIDNEHAFWKSVVIPDGEPELAEKIALLKMTGLNFVAKQYGAWSYYNVTLMMEVIDEMLHVDCGEAVQMMKQFYLQEHIRELSVSGFVEEARELTDQLNGILPADSEDGDWPSYLKMVNSSTEMMNFIQKEDLPGAMNVLKRMEKECGYSCIEAVRVLMHSCLNMSIFSVIFDKPEYLTKALAMGEKTALLYPEDEEIRARLISCRVQELQYLYLTAKSISDTDLQKKLQEIDQSLSALPFGKSDSGDKALGVAWASAKTLGLNLISKSEAPLRETISQARAILDKNPHLTEVASTMINGIRALHRNALKDKISGDEVREAFRYVEANVDSAVLRKAFFEMLEESEEAGNRREYMTKWVTWGARQDARYNPMYDSGIEEIDEEEQMLQSLLSDFEPQEPYRRSHPKIGANSPCPCGSGRKFKKCCRGKGKYD